MIDKKLLQANDFNQKGIEFANKGDLDSAMTFFRKAIDASPSGNSHYLLGLALQMKGDFEGAFTHYQNAVKLSPNFSMAHNNLGALYLGKNDFEKAINHFESSISSDPNNANAHNNLGNALKNTGKVDRAIESYKKALQLTPNIPETLNNLGIIYFEKGDSFNAAKYVKLAIEADPAYALAYFHLAIILNKLGDSAEAAKSLERYTRLASQNADGFALLGNTYLNLGLLEKSKEAFKKSLEIEPNSGQIINDLGNIYKQSGDLTKALEYYKKAISIDPKLAGSYNNIGVIYLNQGNYPKAIEALEKAIKLDPKMGSSYYHLGIIQEKQGEIDKAAKNLKLALKIDPDIKIVRPIYLYVLMQQCEWQEAKKEALTLDKLFLKGLKSGQPLSETPFLSVIRKEDPKVNYLIAKSKSDQIQKNVGGAAPYSFKNRDGRKKIRVGYLSNDYSTHATAHLILGLFGSHDRSKFEIYTYSYGKDDESFYRKKIIKDSDKFTDIRNLGFRQSADLIYKDGVDILVELKGHTGDSRLEICALRPSPIQVSYLGFPGSTGASFIDYIITDRIVTPPNITRFYSEKPVYMPNCYQINDGGRQIWEGEMTRKRFEIPQDNFVFSCFNHSYKIDEETFTAWMEILKKTPGSVLWLFEDNKTAVQNIKSKAKALGVNPKRIIFAGELPNPMHLRRLSLSNLGLDTFICNGHTTTSDCLWAGLPVLTLQGKHFASRVASSILTAAGLPELITRSKEEYISLAVQLAKNPKKLSAIRESLILNRLPAGKAGKSFPLFDTHEFVRDLEKAYSRMWEIYAAGKKPQEIIV